jgi:hypothetical protein
MYACILLQTTTPHSSNDVICLSTRTEVVVHACVEHYLKEVDRSETDDYF